MKELSISRPKINAKMVKAAAIPRGIPTITELARRVPCSIPSIYFALERPSRFSRVRRRIKELTGL